VAGPKLVLASASPRRRELLSAIGLEFQVAPSDIDETLLSQPAGDMAIDLAFRKAMAVRPTYPSAVVIAADTIVSIEARSLGKPESTDEAREMLSSLRDRWHEVTTGIAVFGSGPARLAVTTRVLIQTFELLSPPVYCRRPDEVFSRCAVCPERPGPPVMPVGEE
jgi:septum formation protein